MTDLWFNHLVTLLLFAGLLFGGGWFIGLAHRLNKNRDAMVEHINKILPQTQCGQCGHPGCLPYAKAIAKGEAINKCPPGGQEVIAQLTELLGRSSNELEQKNWQPTVAMIRANECIGCTLCIKACPVDAIIGAPKRMHTVLTDYCTGCDLCLSPCPVDCIDMIPLKDLPDVEQFTQTIDWQNVSDQRNKIPTVPVT